MSATEMSHALPELTVAALLLGVLILDLAGGEALRVRSAGAVCLLGVLLSLSLALRRWAAAEAWMSSFHGALLTDPLSRLAGIAALTGTVGVLLLCLAQPHRSRAWGTGAFYSLVLTSLLGALIVTGADGLLVLALGLALTHVPLQVLAGWRAPGFGREAGLRLAQVAGLAWILAAAGMALVWLEAGTLDYGDLAQALEREMGDTSVLLGVGFILLAMALLAGVAPLHQSVMDLHQGATPPVAALMSACALPALLVGAIRLLVSVCGPLADTWSPVLAVAAATASATGAVLAAVQDRVRRLLAALLCCHGGALLLGLASGSDWGLAAALFLLLVQVPAALLLASLYQAGLAGPATSLTDLAGLARRHPLLAALLACGALSLAGLPPTAGYAGRILVYHHASAAGHGWAVAVVVAAQAVASWAAVRLLAATASGRDEADEADRLTRLTPPGAAVMALGALSLVALGLYPEPLLEVCRAVALTIL